MADKRLRRFVAAVTKKSGNGRHTGVVKELGNNDVRRFQGVNVLALLKSGEYSLPRSGHDGRTPGPGCLVLGSGHLHRIAKCTALADQLTRIVLPCIHSTFRRL